MAYWVFIVANWEFEDSFVRGIDIFHCLMGKGEWGFGERTPHRKHVKGGDTAVFYISRGSGASSYMFWGVAKVAKDPYRAEDPTPVLIGDKNIRDSPIRVPLTEVKVWNQGVPIQPLIPRLKFIKKTESWGIYLMGGVRRINKEDFDEILASAGGRGVVPRNDLRNATYELTRKRVRRTPQYEPGLPKLLASGEILHVVPYKDERALEDVVVRHAKDIFGERTLYFNLKSKIRSKSDIAGIPDGYLMDFSDPNSTRFFLVENELERHEVFDHIVAQVMRFSEAFDYGSKRKIRDLLYDEIKADEDLARQFKAFAHDQNVYRVLDEMIHSDFGIVIVIDRSSPQLTRVRSALEGVAAEIRILELMQFSRERGKESIYLVSVPK